MKPQILIDKTTENFDYWINQEFINEDLKKELKTSDLLFVPNKGFRDREDLNFPVNTMELLDYVKENSDKKFIADICIEDKDYKELALHYDWIILTDILVREFILPIYLSVVSNYLFSKWQDKTKEKGLKCEITVIKKKNSLKIKYEGPVKSFKDEILKELKKFEENENE